MDNDRKGNRFLAEFLTESSRKWETSTAVLENSKKVNFDKSSFQQVSLVNTMSQTTNAYNVNHNRDLKPCVCKSQYGEFENSYASIVDLSSYFQTTEK